MFSNPAGEDQQNKPFKGDNYGRHLFANFELPAARRRCGEQFPMDYWTGSTASGFF
jgi:hypothetical protein